MNGNIYKDGTYFKKTPTWHKEDSSWKAKQIIQLINRNNLKFSTVCEVGCGAGEILNQLSKKLGNDIKFTGYEISPQAFDMCQKNSKENLKFYLKDPFVETKAFFDVVMAIDVFEHVEDYYGFLRQLKEKGRYKIFHIPLDLSVQTVFRSSKIINVRKSSGHIHYFTKKTALATLEDTEYEILDWLYTCHSLELPNRGWKANLLKIPRSLFFTASKELAVRGVGGFSLMVLAK